tara:strand:- start:353 stop:2941 length:2589 start_codon:yes stop_codon:yes gene_type:complete
MTAVTQRIDNYLGGVSKQSDDKKLPGQVRECLNGYPDPTFGLTKRPGFKWIANLGTGTTYDSSKWFYLHRENDEKYIGCIKPASGGSTGDIDIWNAVTGAACTVNYGTGAQAYLTGARTNYHLLTVQDTSIITNNLITAAKIADPSFTANKQATLELSGTSVLITYVIVVAGTTVTVTTDSDDTYDDALTKLKAGIDAASISGLTTTKYQTTLQLTRSSAFTITATGGSLNSSITVFQDQVDNIAQLPVQTAHNHTVKVINTSSANDTYWAKFVADNGTSGPGFWEETLDPSKSTGLDNTTMPHELVNNSTNTFTFQKITYTSRLVGDDVTNNHPSFVGQKIQQSFFYGNRLGFLSSDSVIFSQSGQHYNFYHTSAQTLTDADPIDLEASTTKPATLHGILPTTQGLVLFSKNQQFLMTAEENIFTPTRTTIRTISNYEMDDSVDPIDMGSNINFISKTPSYTRIFGMVTRGQDENPEVLDVGRVVNEWVPATVDTFIASTQNQFIAMSSQSEDKVYFYLTYSDGEKNIVQSWFNWQLPGNVQTIAVDQDEFYAVTKQGNQFTLSKASLSQSPSDAIIVNNDGQRINPCVDLYATASSVAYDATNDLSKCYIPWVNVTGLTPVLIIKGTTATGQFIDSGFTITPGTGSDGTGAYFSVPRKNLTSIASDVVVGWKYDFDIILPKTYFRTDENMVRTDFTANLTVARMKFAVGLSGLMAFKLKSTGVRQGKKEYTGDGSTTVFNWVVEDLDYIDKDQIKVTLDGVATTAFTVSGDTQITFSSAPGDKVKIVIYLDEWYNLNPTQTADTYLANDIALSEQSVFTIPIHQKTNNFQLRIFNDSPFPVSLNSMMWEGNYSPRFYTRK